MSEVLHVSSWENRESIARRGLVPECRMTMTEEHGHTDLFSTNQLLDKTAPGEYPSRECATYFQPVDDRKIPEGADIPLLLKVDSDALKSCAVTWGGNEKGVRTLIGGDRAEKRAERFWKNVETCTGDECVELLDGYRPDPEIFCDNRIDPGDITFSTRRKDLETDGAVCQQLGDYIRCDIPDTS